MTPAGLEPAIPGSVDRCLIHWATGAWVKILRAPRKATCRESLEASTTITSPARKIQLPAEGRSGVACWVHMARGPCIRTTLLTLHSILACLCFTMDTLGIEPRASRMLSGCDTTTPRAL